MTIGGPIVIKGDPPEWGLNQLVPIATRGNDSNMFREDYLQALIDASPDLLPVREFLSSTRCLFSLAREVPVELGGSQGYIDNLLVTNEGYLVIVEAKLHRNSEATREVVAQTLQYGMAISELPLLELEARIKRGVRPALSKSEGIREAVFRVAAERNQSGLLADNFEEALERNLRRGEFLLIIVTDGIHIAVERIGQWLNDQGQGSSQPFKFGLIELKFYTHGQDRLVIPRAILKTRELTRHVVVVDINPRSDVEVSARVTDEYRTTTGGRAQESRSIRPETVPMTKASLLEALGPGDAEVAAEIIEQLTAYGFDQRATGAYLNFGFTFPEEDGDHHHLIALGKDGVWIGIHKKLRDLLGSEGMIERHQEANRLGPFFRGEQMENPNSGGSAVKFAKLKGAVPQLVAFLDEQRSKFRMMLESGP